MSKIQKDFGSIFWFHLVFILFTYATPILFSYWLVIVGVALLQLQYYVFGGCVLTHAELGTKKYQSFYYHYLHPAFPRLKQRPVWIFSTYILSGLGVMVSLVLQLGFGLEPLIV